jgi:pimeloyl-ACP methyl ester carboxylesterase
MMQSRLVRASDGVGLYVEIHGEAGGTPILFAHEFAATGRSFDGQVQAFAQRHRCVLCNARGYAPSELPEDISSYTEVRAAEDLADVIAALGDQRAHLVGVSMGAAAALQLALKHPQRVASLTLASIGSGSDRTPEEVRTTTEANARLAESQGTRALALQMANSPTRRRLREKQPGLFEDSIEDFARVPALAAALTMRGVQQRRPSLYTHAQRLRALQIPMLVLAGAEDPSCVKAGEFLRDTMPGARLVVFEQTGHAIPLEEPERFNAELAAFLDPLPLSAKA